jgi:TPP-dependent indolepyruvate ferredoxin oxidoreductase alpha subunit
MRSGRVTLDDKYDLSKDRILVTGFQALVRLCMMQKERDRRAGLNTAGLVTGYRGSPLGTLDQQFIRARRFLDRYDVRFQAGLNEDLAATALWGSQQAELRGRAGSTACSVSGTARARVSTAPATSFATPISPAPRATAACSP